MGSSSVWNKAYIKENIKVLKKEIFGIYATREEADIEEVKKLKACKNDPLYINKYFNFTPDTTGIKQTLEWMVIS